MLRIATFLLLITLTSTSNSLLNSNAIGRGCVDIAIGGSSNSILLNPSNLETISQDPITVEPIDFSIVLNRDTLDFLTELSSDFSDAQKVSELMKKNIGNTLSFRMSNFASIYQTYDKYSWLLGFNNDMSGHFITHSGFGSIGAMESYIERYRSMVGTVSHSYQNLDYGITLRGVEKYQTTHNYSIGEIIENDSFMDYFDNKYTKKESAIAFDIGANYKIQNNPLDTQIAFSILDIGDTDFKTIGKIPSTTNIGFSSKYNKFLFGMDYIDLFGEDDSIRFGVSREFFENSLTLSSGILYESFTFGIDYHYSIFGISLGSYREKEYNRVKNRKYKLSFSIAW
jgi:hypothetical protein